MQRTQYARHIYVTTTIPHSALFIPCGLFRIHIYTAYCTYYNTHVFMVLYIWLLPFLKA